MVRPYSLDLRERVVAAVADGQSCRAAADTFGVSVASVVKWSQQFQSKGSAAAKPMGGRRPWVLEGERGLLLAHIREEPDITVRALAGELVARGIVISHVSVWNLLGRENQTFKKSVLASEQDRSDVARRRKRWRRHQHRLDARRLVFIDEAWAKTNMAPLRGWCARDKRLVGKVPHGHWQPMTFIAALRSNRIDAPCVIDGPINGESFLAYVEQILVPTLKPGDVVIMDNLGSHKGAPCARQSAPPARTSCSCRPARPISTLSSKRSRNSRRCVVSGDRLLQDARMLSLTRSGV